MISFHSLEDRIVKTFIARESRDEVDRRAPFAPPTAAAAEGARRASSRAPARSRANPRARSAIMRVAERTGRSAGMTQLQPALLLRSRCCAAACCLVRTLPTTSRRLFAALDRAQHEQRSSTPSSSACDAERAGAGHAPARRAVGARASCAMRTATPASRTTCDAARRRACAVDAATPMRRAPR